MRSNPPHARAVLTAVLAAAFACTGASVHAEQSDSIVTDRPDFVESSNVVGKGRFQIETSVLAERKRDDLGRDTAFSTPTLLRAGIGDALELRIETDGRTVARNTDYASGLRTVQAGYSDTSLGIKWHIADEHEGAPSLGLLVHADLASGSSAFRGDGVRPSLRVSAEWDLPADLSLGVMPGIAVDRNARGERFHYGILGVVLGKEINERTRGFVEIATPQIARAVDGGTLATFDVGAAWLLSPSCQLDTMLSRGLNRRTADLSWTVGLSIKL
jgi:hypothetical protein